MSLATVADLEARLGRPVADETRAQALLDDASAQVRAYTRQTFTLVTDDVVTTRPVGMRVRLPQRPVTEVTAVVMVGCERDGIPDLPLPSWCWDGIDIVDLSGLDPDVWVELPAWWEDWWRTSNPTYRVTYSHGYAEVPPAVVSVVSGMVLRTLTSPSMVAGMVSENIGQYGYQLQQGAGAAGASVRLSGADKQALIDAGYKRTATTIATPVG